MEILRLARLGGFWDEVEPARFPACVLRFRNDRHASRVGLGGLDDAAWARHFHAFDPLPANLSKPLAMRYHGHQFGVYNPNLGDGRGFLFAQVRDDLGRLLDLGTKGSGQTPWSRLGDGRLTLKGGVREVLATEMLEALGVYTSTSFSLYETGESLMRGDEPSPTRSSVLVRLSHGHIRFGNFQRFAWLREEARSEALLEYAIDVFYPWLGGASERTAAFLEEVCHRSARLAAAWMAAGFVHGVLNTDNMNVTGESFDYGPWRFLPHYDPGFTAAYFDETGRYAYGRQPEAVRWNLQRLAEALAPLATKGSLDRALAGYDAAFTRALHESVCARLGVTPRGHDEDEALIEALYAALGATRVLPDRVFFHWFGGPASEARAMRSEAGVSYRGAEFGAFTRALAGYTPARPERLAHPYFTRPEPVHMHLDVVEAVWQRIDIADDWSLFEQTIADVREMGEALALAPSPRPLVSR
jgi:uncharacterized protein YdiU (UPF0061 family)